MSLSIDIHVVCDACLERHDDANVSVRQARRAARSDGWHFTRDRRDICEDCWEAGER